MFTGIIETTARVVAIAKEKTNYHFTLTAPFAEELKINQSMAHDGCCLTVVRINPERKEYVVTAMLETMQRTNLSTWQVGSEVNVERSMRMDGRFDGHIVQGHVDQTARCTRVVDEHGSWRFYFEYDPTTAPSITVPKGSISINGVSLTVVDSDRGKFSVSIIPYTYEVTNFHNFRGDDTDEMGNPRPTGTVVNIEFDVFGKYVQRLLEEYMKQQQ